MYVTTISSQRQITLPAALLLEMGVKVKDKLMLKNIGSLLEVKPMKGSLTAKIAGSLSSYNTYKQKQLSDEELKNEWERVIAEELAHD